MVLPVGVTEEQLREVLQSAGLDSADIESVVRTDEAESIEVERCDFRAKIGNVKRTDEGFLQGSAAVAKVGILTYYLPNGGTRKELVTDSCLFNDGSMATLKLKPVTDTHPTKLVTSLTAGRKKVGTTGETVQRTDGFLTTSLVITDDDAIKSVEAGRQELSPGYRADVLMKPGTWEGQRYDGIQVRRVYNHLAICDRARGGQDLRINFDEHTAFDGFAINEDVVLTAKQRDALPDSSFAIVTGSGNDKVRKLPIHDKVHVRDALARLPQSDLSLDEKTETLTRIKRRAEQLGIKVNVDSVAELEALRTDDTLFTTSPKRSRFMNRITLDGIDYEADQQVINSLRKIEGERTDLQTKLDAQKAELDTMTAERDTLKTKNDELEAAAKDQTGLKARVDARLKLMEVAKDYLDEEVVKKLDEMTDADVRKAVIVKRFPDTQAKMDDKDTTEEYVSARFDTVVELISKEKEDGKGSGGDKGTRTDGLGNQRKQTSTKTDGKGGERDQDSARKDMADRMTGAWKPPETKKD